MVSRFDCFGNHVLLTKGAKVFVERSERHQDEVVMICGLGDRVVLVNKCICTFESHFGVDVDLFHCLEILELFYFVGTKIHIYFEFAKHFQKKCGKISRTVQRPPVETEGKDI